MKRLRTAVYVLRYLGLRFAWVRAKLAADKVLHRTRRRFRPRPWDSIDLDQICRSEVPANPRAYADWKLRNLPAFFFPLGCPPSCPASIEARSPTLPERIALLEEDRCVYFFRTPSPTPVQWHRNPFDGSVASADATWCDIPDYLPAQGDPRVMWEPSRCAWAVDLAQARARDIAGDPSKVFMSWLDSWMEANPPFRGFQWKCGQESSVRFLALALGFWATSDESLPHTRWQQFARLAWATGYRVANHIDYAISQKNNHAISEALGLMLIAHLFPEFRDAPRWRELGRRVVTRELRRQVYEDGSYCQQSTNYQRVMMQGAMLAIRLAEIEQDPLDRDLYDLLARCAAFLWQLTDPRSGRVPQYGNNDGAWILPLSQGPFWDFRPLLQATWYVSRRQRLLEPGPWDVDMLWLFGAEALEAPVDAPKRQSSRFDAGGYYTLRASESWAMMRCCHYRDRMGHLDQLGLDLWWRGLNVLRDCGTYLYYIPGRESKEAYFSSQAAHNVVRIDEADPAERVSRFMRFPWPDARLLRHEGTPRGLIEAEFDGYRRRPWRVRWRRSVACLGNCWLIVDDLFGRGAHQIAVQWHVWDWPAEYDRAAQAVRFTTPEGPVNVSMRSPDGAADRFELVRSRDVEQREQGLASTFYATEEAASTMVGAWEGGLPKRIITCIGLGASPSLLAEDREGCDWLVQADEADWRVRLGPIGESGRTLEQLARTEV